MPACNADQAWRTEVKHRYARVVNEPETDEKCFVQHRKQNRATRER
jgi:hypothetical protein